MKITALAIPDIKLVTPKIFRDDRGFFSETFNVRVLASGGIAGHFVQDNHSLSSQPGVVRGLHYQLPPSAQDKLVRVIRGAILDVAVDIRRGSPTYGQHVAVTLSAENWDQLWIPKGFAHGFCTLEPIPRSSTRSPTTTRPNSIAACAGTIPTSASNGPYRRIVPSCRPRMPPRPSSVT